MVKRVFCIGNGESRKGFDLEQLRPLGTIYGCNAIYRDFKPDVLVGVDHGIIHEIYRSGYAYDNECWFRGFSRLPAMTFDMTVHGTEDKETIKKNLEKYGTYLPDNRKDETHFVFHGINLTGKINILVNGKKEKKEIDHTGIYVTWVRDDDKANDLTDIIKPKDRGWACGATSGLIALLKEQPDELYMIGHDLNSKDGKLNNLYKGTNCYAPAQQSAIPSVNWIDQWKKLFREFTDTKFIKVNEVVEDRANAVYVNDAVNKKVLEWDGTVKNLEYIDFNELKRRLTLA